ncbi:MAG: hypothetical protein AAF570_07375 [Bacteroidota bacterium]
MKSFLNLLIVGTGLLLLCRNAHAQFDQTAEYQIKSAFYINDCQQKVTELDCYDFENMMVAFEYKDILNEFDYLIFHLQLFNVENNWNQGFSARVDMANIQRVFGEKPYAYIELFGDGREDSEYFTTSSAMQTFLRRANFAYSAKKPGHRINAGQRVGIRILGEKIVGTKRKVEREYDGSLVERNVPITQTRTLYDGREKDEVLKCNNRIQAKYKVRYPLILSGRNVPLTVPKSGCYDHIKSGNALPETLSF